MKKLSRKTFIANIFGTLGYLMCLFLWSWIGLLYIPIALENEQIERFIMPAQSEEIPTYTPTGEIPPFMVFVALAITTIVILTTLAVFIKAPVTIARTGKAATTKVANTALPVVSRHHTLPPAKKKILTSQLVKLAKLLLVLVPVVIGLVLDAFVTTPLPFDIAALVMSMFAVCAILAFSTQYLFARLLKVDAGHLV